VITLPAVEPPDRNTLPPEGMLTAAVVVNDAPVVVAVSLVEDLMVSVGV
jgi:hypothetical protein